MPNIRYGWVIIITTLLLQSLNSRLYAQVSSPDTVYNQSYEWRTGHREELPEWIFASRQQGRVMGISDPGMTPEAARTQALQRAAYLYSLQQGAHLHLLSDVFTTTDTSTHTYEVERNKMLTLGMIKQSARKSSYRIEKEYTSAYGEMFVQVVFAETGSSDLSYHFVSELMLLLTKERVEEEEIKFDLLLQATDNAGRTSQSSFGVKGALTSLKIDSDMNGASVNHSQKGYWYKNVPSSDTHEASEMTTLENGFWNAYMVSLTRSLLLHPFSGGNVSRVSDCFNGTSASDRALYREKITVALSISSCVRRIQNNRLCIDWKITKEPNSKQK